MYNRYRKCCCQNDYDPDVIESLCQNAGTTVEYAQTDNLCFNCNCGCNNCGICCECTVNSNSNCGCGFDEEQSAFPSNPMLAQSYVPVQRMNRTFTPCCGLKMGTIFPELVSPYMPSQSIREIEYLRNSNEIGEGCNKC